MLNTYLKIAFRNPHKSKLFSYLHFLGLTSRDYINLLFSTFPASPPRYPTKQGLQDFTYKVHTRPLGTALLTVSFQSVRTIRMNPVKSLRTLY